VQELETDIASLLVGADRERFEQTRKQHVDAGHPLHWRRV